MATIDELISKEALDNVVKLTDSILKAADGVDKLYSNSKKLDAALSATGSGKSGVQQQKEINEASKEAMRINNELAKTQAKLNSVEQGHTKELERQKQKLNQLNKEQKQLINIEKSEANSLEELRAKNAKLRTERDRLNIFTKEGRKQLSEYNKEINQNNKLIEKNTDASNKQKMAVGGYFKNILSAAGVIGGVSAITAGVISVFKNASKNAREFEVALDELSAITGATGKDLDYLKQQAIDLSNKTGKSAVDITEAFKMVGSAKPELLKDVTALSGMTDAVLTLSKASGMDLSTTTESLTTIMNQFGVSAADAGKYINILAAGSKYGAVEVPYLSEAISKVGTVANAAGLSIEQTTAAMELFGEKGVKAETAGRSFKTILVKLQGDSKNYTNGVFDLNKAIDNNMAISGDNMALQKKFGLEFFSQAQILLQNKDRFLELNKQITGTNTAYEQAAVNSNNLQTSINKLSAKWDNFTMNLMKSDGPISNAFKSIIEWADRLLTTLDLINKHGSLRKARDFAAFINPAIEEAKKTGELYAKQLEERFSKEKYTEEQIAEFIQKKREVTNNRIKELNQSAKKITDGDAKAAIYANAWRLKTEFDTWSKHFAKKKAVANTAETEINKNIEKESEKSKKIAADNLKFELEIYKEKNKSKINSQRITVEMYNLEISRITKILEKEKEYAKKSIDNKKELELAILKLDNSYLDDVKSLDKQLLDADKERLKDAWNEFDAYINRILAKEISKVETQKNIQIAFAREQFQKGKINEEQYTAEIERINYESEQRKISIQVDSLKKQLNLTGISDEKKLELTTKLAESEQALSDANFEHFKTAKNKEVELEKQTSEKKKQAMESLKESSIAIANEVFNFTKAKNEAAISELETQKEYELELAGDNEKRKKQIETKYAKEISAIRLKQAKIERAQSVFNIAVSTASGIMKALDQLGAYGWVAAAAIGALGAAQTASVLATPLPKYAEGTDYHVGGKAIVGEEGTELIESKGKFSLTPNHTSIIDLPTGAKVYPHDESMKMLMTKNDNELNNSLLLAMVTELKRSNKSVNKTDYDTIITGKTFRDRRISKYFG